MTTPTDTDLSVRHTPTNHTTPCTCGHRHHIHATQGRPICLICTTTTGGCGGYTPQPSQAQRDAFLAGYKAGAWAQATKLNGNPIEDATTAYTRWTEGG